MSGGQLLLWDELEGIQKLYGFNSHKVSWLAKVENKKTDPEGIANL